MPTGAGHLRREAVWSQESSGAAVRMQRPEVSCSGLCRVGMLSAPSGPLPSWELSPWVFSLSRSRPVCVEASIREQKWNFRLHHIRFFCVRDYSFSCFYVSCRRKPLMVHPFLGCQATLEPLSGKGSGIGGYTSSSSS